jgi:hypothetical protein
VVASLASARVFVPVVAQLAEEAEGAHGVHADKQADMALVTLKAPDGRLAMPVFTSAEALAAWHPEARPVAVYAARAALSAVAEGAELLVVDPGSEVTFVVRRPGVWALAQQQQWLPAYLDTELAAVLRARSRRQAGRPRTRGPSRRGSRHHHGLGRPRRWRRGRAGTAGGPLPGGRT